MELGDVLYILQQVNLRTFLHTVYLLFIIDKNMRLLSRCDQVSHMELIH